MSGIRRYSWNGLYGMEELHDGDYVLHSDHEAEVDCLRAEVEGLRKDTERLNYIEKTFSGTNNRERYLPVTMIWGAGAMGRTLRQAVDKYIGREAGEGASA